ncbi:hypothetical protein ACQCVK_04290 [Rossellomorea vietnamensis]|uniref:DUF4376 domain-containing protein n=1 Tax=Rossellomorea vietnamensis TaxID=218284 RepID=UPI003CF732A2
MQYKLDNQYEERLLNLGIDQFMVEDKNNFIIQIAREKGLPITDITNEYLLNLHKELKKGEFGRMCNEEIVAGFTSAVNGHTYSTDNQSQFNMFAEYIMTKDDTAATEIMYKAEDVGKQIPHTKDEFQAVVMGGFKHVKGFLTRLDVLRDRIREAQTDAELLEINWEDEI